MKDTLLSYLNHICGKENVRQNEPLSKYTTFRVGGPAKYFVFVQSKEILQRLLSALNFLDFPYFIIGMGANILASDAGYNGVIIKLEFKEIFYNDEFLYADAGAKLGVVGNFAKEKGLTGLEWSTGIPATIGGAVYMNCGAFSHEMKDIVVMVDVIDNGQVKTLTANQLEFGYRHSIFQEKNWIIIGAYLRLEKGSKEDIANEMKNIIQKRSNHPKEPSAGSTFKRPHDGFFVGKVIEDLGLKNFKIGGARISDKHCGFIVNDGDATCDDILQLIYKVQDAVEKATATLIDTEVVFLGEITQK